MQGDGLVRLMCRKRQGHFVLNFFHKTVNFKMYNNAITNDKIDGVKILSDEYIAFSLSREGEK